MTAFIGTTAKTITLPIEDFDDFLYLCEDRRFALRAEWHFDAEEPIVYLRMDILLARHAQERFGERSIPAMKAISGAFGIPPRNWQAYGGSFEYLI